MPLSAEQIYNDLNGEQVKEILLTRCADLFSQVPEFRRHLTLPRVRMSINIHLEVVGRTPPSFEINDDLVVRVRNVEPPLPGSEETENVLDLQAIINSDTDSPDGQPPDQIREEHGISITAPNRRASKGMALEDQNLPVAEGGQRYARFITQDYGPARVRTGFEGPVVGGEIISKKNAGGGRPEVSPDFSKVKDPNYSEQE